MISTQAARSVIVEALAELLLQDELDAAAPCVADDQAAVEAEAEPA